MPAQSSCRTCGSVATHTSVQLANALSMDPDPRVLVRLRTQRTLIWLRSGTRFLYPEFQIDRTHGRINPTVATVNRELLRSQHGYDALHWWHTGHAHLDGFSPLAALADPMARELLLRCLNAGAALSPTG